MPHAGSRRWWAAAPALALLAACSPAGDYDFSCTKPYRDEIVDYGTVFSFAAAGRAIPLYDNFPDAQYRTTANERAVIQQVFDVSSDEMTEYLTALVVIPDPEGSGPVALVDYVCGMNQVELFAAPAPGRLGYLEADSVGLATTLVHELRHLSVIDFRWVDSLSSAYYVPTRDGPVGPSLQDLTPDEFTALYAELYARDTSALADRTTEDSDLKTAVQAATDAEAFLRTAGKWVGRVDGRTIWRAFAASPDDFLNAVDSPVTLVQTTANGRAVTVITMGFLILDVNERGEVLLAHRGDNGRLLHEGTPIAGLPFVSRLLSGAPDMPSFQPLPAPP